MVQTISSFPFFSYVFFIVAVGAHTYVALKQNYYNFPLTQPFTAKAPILRLDVNIE